MRRLLLPTACLLIATANADEDVANNLANSAGAQIVLDTSGETAAQAFVTGPEDSTLKRITVKLRHFGGSGPSSSVEIGLWTGSGSVPDTLVENLGVIPNIISVSDHELGIDSTSRPVLTASTRYWVSMKLVSGEVDWRNTGDASVSGVGSMPEARATSSNGNPGSFSEFGAGSGNRQLMAVEIFAPLNFIVNDLGDAGTGTLREAVADSILHPGPDLITFAPGLPGNTITLTSGTIFLADEATIDATSVPGGILISGNGDGNRTLDANESRIFESDVSANFLLKGLRLMNGQVSTTANDDTARGGVIFNRGILTLEQCEIVDSTAQIGGAIFNAAGASLEIYDSTLSGGLATSLGGAIRNDGTARIVRCTLNANEADNAGGAIHNNGGLTIENSTLSGNQANGGGGGGAIANITGATLDLLQVTLTDNTASSAINGGGGIFSNGDVTIENSVIAGNSAPNGPGPDLKKNNSAPTVEGINFVGDVSDSLLVEGAQLLTGDPLLGPLADNGGLTQTHHPLAGSPLIDQAGAGSTSPLTTDQRGSARVSSGRIDIGAVEVEAATVAPAPPTIKAPRKVFAKNGTAKIRGSSQGAAKVVFSAPGQRGFKPASGSPNRWLVKLKNLKKPKTKVQIRAVASGGAFASKSVSVVARK